MGKDKWWSSMIEIHGSEEAVRTFMREKASKSSRNKVGTGGFHKMAKEDPERFITISSKGGKTSRK